MTATSLRRAFWWTVVVSAAAAAAFGVVAARRVSLERNYRDQLVTEAKRRAIDIFAQTMSGNVMGAVATMGLVNHPLKDDASGAVAPNGPMALEPLRANGEAHHATALYVVNGSGIVQSCFCPAGKPLTGVDVGFRPYYQIAMQGRQNVSAGTSATTGTAALYVAAPLYEEVSSRSPVIGAVVARLGIERVDSVLKDWPNGPALLVSPQQVTFASSRSDWIDRAAAPLTSEQLERIRDLKQFSRALDERPPAQLPFDIGDDVTRIEGRRYAVARAPVQWNDPQGEWSLVLLGDLDEVMPARQRALIGVGSGVLMLGLGLLLISWRTRLQRANAARAEAEASQQAYAMKLYFDSEIKSFIADASTELHQAETLPDFARTFMYHVTTRVAAEYGAFYVLDGADGQLKPIGGYGVAAADLEPVAMGQGLVGQCAMGKSPLQLAGDAEAPVRIVCGAGAVSARSLLLLPVMHADQLLGVVLFASLQAIDDEQRALLDTMLPMVAMNLDMLVHHLSAQSRASLVPVT